MPGRDGSTLPMERTEPRLDVVEVLDDGSCGRCVSRSGRVRSTHAAVGHRWSGSNHPSNLPLKHPKLRAGGWDAEPAKPAAGRGECSVPEPVAVKRLRVRDNVIEFPDEPILDC